MGHVILSNPPNKRKNHYSIISERSPLSNIYCQNGLYKPLLFAKSLRLRPHIPEVRRLKATNSAFSNSGRILAAPLNPPGRKSGGHFGFLQSRRFRFWLTNYLFLAFFPFSFVLHSCRCPFSYVSRSILLSCREEHVSISS